MSHDLNKICVTFPSPILDMIIVCFIYFANSLFAGLILAVLRLYSQCQNFSFLQCSDEKIPISSRKKILKKKSSFCRVNCVHCGRLYRLQSKHTSNSGLDQTFMPCSGYISFAAEQRVEYQISWVDLQREANCP